MLALSGCGVTSDDVDQPGAINTYKDIPGITEEEISAIETLKEQRSRFLYGSVFDAEAFMLTSGSFAGFSPKFCALLSGLFGVEFVLQLHSRDSLESGLYDMSIDFTGDLSPTAERVRNLFMTYPIAERTQKIFTLSGSRSIEDETDIVGLKIGFCEGAIDIEAVNEYYPDISFTPVIAENFSKAVEMLKDGVIDAFVTESVTDPMFDIYDFIDSKDFFPLVYTSVSLSTANPELSAVISAVNKYILAGGIDKLYEFYEEGNHEYMRYKLRQNLTREERYYIDFAAATGKTIKTALQYDNYPICFYNETDREYQGIAVEILAELSRLTGLSFEYVKTGDMPWSQLLEMLKTNEVSLISQLIQTEDRQGSYLWPELPYATTNYALISKIRHPNLAAYQVSRARVGVVTDTVYELKYRAWFPENDNITGYDSISDAFTALEKDEVDLLMGSYYMLLAEQNYREKPGYKTNIRFGTPMDSYFGVNINEETLCSIITKAQGYIDTDTIVSNWETRGFDYAIKYAEERAQYMSIFIIFLIIILLFVVFLLFRNVALGKELHKIASRDSLTGILNRRYFMESSAVQIERCIRVKSGCYIIVFDLDHFKKVNDTYGHQAGDKVLKEVAARVKRSIRPYDLFGRYGGEEFIVLMPDIKKDDAMKAAERMRLDIAVLPVEFEDKQIMVTASFGVACAAPENDLDNATKYADEALYEAKNSGRNRVVYYEQGGLHGEK